MLQDSRKEFVISKQVLRSCTAIGALIGEAELVSKTLLTNERFIKVNK